MPRKQIVADTWQGYAAAVIPAGAPVVQVRECKRSFYAGAGLVLRALKDAVGPDDVSEDEGNAIMEAVDAEIRAFLKAVKNGRA